MTKTGLAHNSFSVLGALLLSVTSLMGCGGDGGGGGTGETGTVTVTLSDPPVCKGRGSPSNQQFDAVYVTVTKVRAHVQSGAGDGDAGWVDLVDLTQDPAQIDLLDQLDTECVLATLGSTTGLPAGNYGQIRLHLLSNSPDPTETVPAPNACAGTGGFNCVVPADSAAPEILLLSSQDRNGIKIPPGQISGGALRLEAGETADINIDFDACKSIVRQGNGRFRLKPTLHAGEVSLVENAIGVTALDIDGDPLPAPATVVVLLEQPDPDDPDVHRPVIHSVAHDGRTVDACPLPGDSYDVVVAAIDGDGVTYDATVTFDVPTGTDLAVPLVPESGPDTSPGLIQGTVTSADAGAAVEVDVSVSALQPVMKDGSEVLVTVPLFRDSTATVGTVDNPATCPTGTACAHYTLFVPASNPRAGTFDPSGTTYTGPAAGDVLYAVNARAFNGSEPNCTPSSLITTQDDEGGALEVFPGVANAVIAQTLSFTGCTAVTP